MSKFSSKKKFKFSAMTTLTLLEIATLLTTGIISYSTANSYVNTHSSLDIDNVINNITIYGGDLRYIDQNFNIFLLKKNPIVSHLAEKQDPYIIGYSSNLSENDKKQFNYVVEYYNELFKIINPKYKFITKVCDESDCDIFVKYDILEPTVNASIIKERDLINSSAIVSALIKFNSRMEMDNATKRLCFAHEIMHILYGSKDVDYTESKTFSIYNYNDVGYMINMIEQSKEPPYASLVDTPHYMSKEKKESFITLTPTDVGTLIAIYGDSSNPTKKCEYLKLLEKTLLECSKVFGDYQPYFEKWYEIPNCDVCKE